MTTEQNEIKSAEWRKKNLSKNSFLADVSGSFGPNDGGYIHQRLVNSAKEIKKAQELYSQGHYAHSNAKIIPQGHPLRVIMEQLAELDKQYAMYANTTPNKDLFSTYEPPIEDTIRWDKYAGEDGK